MSSAARVIATPAPAKGDLLRELRRQLPGRFEERFSWSCGCRPKGSSILLCDNVEHFLTWVNTAIHAYHQWEETVAQGGVVVSVLDAYGLHSQQALRVDVFPPERKAALDADIQTAITLLLKLGVRLPKEAERV